MGRTTPITVALRTLADPAERAGVAWHRALAWTRLRAFLIASLLLVAALPHHAAADRVAQSPTPPEATGTVLRFVPAARAAKKVAIISVRGAIDPMTLQTVERRLDQAAKDGCDAAVIELDTPGGELSSTLAICHLIKTHQVGNVVAWVHPNAYSAGAIIALACREIVVSTDSSIGDAAPISIGADQSLQPLPPTERAKLESPILTEVSDSARRNGYDVRLVRAFISAPDELWLLERDDGKRLFADAREYEIAMGEAPDAMHSTTGRLVVPPPVLIDESPEPTSNEMTDASDPMAELERQAEAEEQFILSSRIAPEERGRWKVLGQVDSATQLVTLRDDEAVRYGLAKSLVNTESELLQFFGGTTIVRYDESWSEGLVRFLISWPVRILLIVVMLVGFFLEAATPGIGAFGAIASIAFLVLVGGPALAGLADWWELACIAIGIILIAVEVIATPGVGIAGIAGGLLLLIGLVFSFTSGDLSSPQTQDDLVIGFFSVLTAFVLSGTCIGFLVRRMPESKLFRRFVLEATVAPRPALAFASAAGMPGVGAIGMAVTDLRPIGRVQFGDMLLEVRSSGGWIGSGRNVRVVAHDGQGLVVEADTGPFPGEGAIA